jgi:hypothetical protein
MMFPLISTWIKMLVRMPLLAPPTLTTQNDGEG